MHKRAITWTAVDVVYDEYSTVATGEVAHVLEPICLCKVAWHSKKLGGYVPPVLPWFLCLWYVNLQGSYTYMYIWCKHIYVRSCRQWKSSKIIRIAASKKYMYMQARRGWWNVHVSPLSLHLLWGYACMYYYCHHSCLACHCYCPIPFNISMKHFMLVHITK